MSNEVVEPAVEKPVDKNEDQHENFEKSTLAISTEEEPTPSSSDGEITKRNLIVNYLPQTITDLELFNIFAPFGALESVRIMKDSKVKVIIISIASYSI